MYKKLRNIKTWKKWMVMLQINEIDIQVYNKIIHCKVHLIRGGDNLDVKNSKHVYQDCFLNTNAHFL